MHVALILPVFNEEKNIINFDNSLNKTFKQFKNKIKFKKVYINDGSKDNSKNLLAKIKKNSNNIKIISFTKNFGHQNAIKAGMNETLADYYLVMDTDMQQNPELLKIMIDTIIESNCDIVQMNKKYDNYEKLHKRLFSFFFYKIFKILTGIDLKKGSSDFYVINREVRNKIVEAKFSNNFIRGFIHWAGFSKIYLSYSPKKRIHGHSKYNIINQLELALTGLYYYTSKVYIFTFLLALISFTVSFAYIFFVIYQYLIGNNLPGWTELAIFSLFFGSTILLLISILLFLVTKIFTIISGKPDYIIKNEKI